MIIIDRVYILFMHYYWSSLLCTAHAISSHSISFSSPSVIPYCHAFPSNINIYFYHGGRHAADAISKMILHVYGCSSCFSNSNTSPAAAYVPHHYHALFSRQSLSDDISLPADSLDMVIFSIDWALQYGWDSFGIFSEMPPRHYMPIADK